MLSSCRLFWSLLLVRRWVPGEAALDGDDEGGCAISGMVYVCGSMCVCSCSFASRRGRHGRGASKAQSAGEVMLAEAEACLVVTRPFRVLFETDQSERCTGLSHR